MSFAKIYMWSKSVIPMYRWLGYYAHTQEQSEQQVCIQNLPSVWEYKFSSSKTQWGQQGF